MSATLDPVVAQRPRLFGLAYRMLGSAAQAEDTVQEAYARWYAEPRTEVRNQAGFLTTVVTRLCLDHLKSARVQRERYPGPWLAEPLALEPTALATPGDEASAEQELERLETISLAFLALLESLTPLERAVYLLHEVFDYSHAEVASILGRNETSCRQVQRRAHRALQSRRPAADNREGHGQLLMAFLQACQDGDLPGLERLLADDVVARSDGGGKVTAARRPLLGARAVARLYLGLARQPRAVGVQVRSVNGWPALVVSEDGRLIAVIQVHCRGARIVAIDAVLNPDKLARLAGELGLQLAV